MQQEPSEPKTIIPADSFCVVGVGASSGGLEAFKELIKHIPVRSGIAFILVQHLDPKHESILVEIIQKVTQVPVREITNNLQIEPDHIYIIPSNTILTVSDGVLTLAARSVDTNDNNYAIDHFLTSLAEVYQTQAIGVILSGTGTDGTRGLAAIKKYGGITFAQKRDTAAYPAMPENAINTNVVDFEQSPEDIVKNILGIQRSILRTVPKQVAPEQKAQEISYNKILTMIDNRKAVDFTYYKQTTIRRRIARRMVLKNFSNIQDYVGYLEANEAELDLLFLDILIPVTEFFRDPKIFEFLTSTAFPAIMKSKPANESLRVWTVGCSTGQETYTLAMVLHEFFEQQSERVKIQIFATDISEVAVMRARTGFYTANEVENVSQERLKKFFTRTEAGYQINKSIRDICVFALHNILINPPFAGIDIISCRNVLIYMDTFLQRKAMATFHYSLNEKGMLLLGRSESAGDSIDLFSSFSEQDKVFTRKLVPGRYIHIAAKRRAEFLANSQVKLLRDERPKDDFQRNAENMILSRSPHGVIINDHFEIVHFRGSTGSWIEPAEGKPSLSVLKIVKRELSVELRTLINKVKNTRMPAKKEGIVMKFPASSKLVTIEVIPLLETINLYFLILFENTAEIMNTMISNGDRELTSDEFRSRQLEKELMQTREDMRTIAEDQEAGNEELLSANEELLSGSEELRSLNEELEISKEELQSTVEELSVSNQELAFRIDQLSYSRSYSEAIITTIREPLVVLDHESKVKSANRAFYNAFLCEPRETEGKNFFELSDHQWDIPELRGMFERTIAETNFFESFEVNIKLSTLGSRSMILNARRILGLGTNEQLVLIAIEDVTGRRHWENQLKESADYLRGVLESSPQVSFTAFPDGKINYYNRYLLNYAGVSFDEAVNEGWPALVHPIDLPLVVTAWEHSVATTEDLHLEMRIRRHDGEYRWHMCRALPTWSTEKKIMSWVGTASDVHDQKMFAESLEQQVRSRTKSLKQSNLNLEHANKNLEQFYFIASHDLQEPLRKIQIFSGMLVDNFMDQMPDNAITLATKISASSVRMSSLIRDVLNFSRVDSDSNAYLATDLNIVINNVMADFSLLIEEKMADIQIGHLPIVEVIPTQINQLFYNLVSNSLKFSKPDVRPLINITCRKLPSLEVAKYPSLLKDASYLEILFEDNGVGFDQRYSEKIFKIFQKLRSQTSTVGTGIGLSICKKIVSIHNGEMYAESRQNEGALFHIILPFKYHGTTELLPGYVA
jgi:two-component system, chemotaxis family, CheB/CheR fusion protein